METNRRFRRPRIVVSRAMRKLRATGATLAHFGLRIDSPLKAARRYGHLKLVQSAPVPLPVPEQAGEGAPSDLPAGPAREAGTVPARPRYVRNSLVGLLAALLLFATWWVVDEVRTSSAQARYFSKLAARMTWRVEPGPSNAIRYPINSPYDARLGYARLPGYLERLRERNFEVAEQARFSPRMLELAGMGINPPYLEKTRAGLTILDSRAHPLFSSRFPERFYESFEDTPPLLAKSLMFIENRELLDPNNPKRNPAVEWDRFGKAVFDKSLHAVVGGGKRVAGGSTLATQIEKYRHSPEGRTSSTTEKIQQMASASLRAYKGGEDTTAARRRILVDYLNTVPLSAKPGFGEVNGIGDGMWVWYGRDFATVNKALRRPLAERKNVLVFKEALSLLIAQRRPSHYLGAGDADLEALTNSHLRVLADQGLITPALRDAAIKVRLRPSRASGLPPPQPNTFVSRKASNAVRAHLAGLLGDPRLYNLDRLDLSVVSTLDASAQQAVTAVLRALRTHDGARAAGLTGHHMLGNGDPAKVVYSFTLLERGKDANYLRIQTDNFDQPLDINEGAKLDLGSTAKLRTLVTYLDIIDQLHKRYAGMPSAELRKVTVDRRDHLSRWALDYLAAIEEPARRELKPMLQAAMERRYSASPGEAFFTGGGLHTFGNFNKDDNGKVMSVRQALRQSTNLVFVRLMRDVVYFYMFESPGSIASLLADADNPRRTEYLVRFADKEGKEFLSRFWQKYRDKSPEDIEKTLLDSFRPTPSRLAAVHRTVWPDATMGQFGDFINAHSASNEITPERAQAMYVQYAEENMSLADRGYVASLHPLELWLARYLLAHRDATLSDVYAASGAQRQEVYQWLFKTHSKHAQDRRIKGLLEMEAFLKIHRQWRKTGYPFDSLTPSYATALGASADRPIALAELMGIIVNDGVKKPTRRVESLHFGKGTPYETLVRYGKGRRGEQVLAPEVARVVADSIREVVSDGTAVRAKSAFKKADGTVVPLGGKTGTGDQRFDVYAPGGRLVESRFVNRSATFVFNIGERYFGSITAYVHGPTAADYDFTSTLPVQLLTTVAPSLMQMFEPPKPAPVIAVSPAPGAVPLADAAAVRVSAVEGGPVEVALVGKAPAAGAPAAGGAKPVAPAEGPAPKPRKDPVQAAGPARPEPREGRDGPPQPGPKDHVSNDLF